MAEWIGASESVVRLTAFGAVLAAMVSWELVAPRRDLRFPRMRRWRTNLGLTLLNTLFLQALFAGAAIAVAASAAAGGFGLLNRVSLPSPLKICAAMILLDLAIYLQHVMLHAVPALWRLHRVHHADLDFDVTTGVRFHPVEMILSMAIKLGVVAAIGAPPVAVLAFEVALNATSMFSHGNVRIPSALDRMLRWFVVTPDMHRVHHSVEPVEMNRNFGFNLSWWDRLLGTYRGQPGAGHEEMEIGLADYRAGDQQTLAWALELPFRADGRIKAAELRQKLEGTPPVAVLDVRSEGSE